MIYLPRCVARIADIANQGSGRYATSAVRLVARPNGGWRLDATNGKFAVVMQGQTDPPPGAVPVIAAGETVPPEALLPAKEFAKAFKALPNSGWSGVTPAVGVALAENLAVLVSGTQRIDTPLVEGLFPQIEAAMPRFSPFSVLLNLDLLMDLLAVVRHFRRDADALPTFRLILSGPTRPVGIVADGPNGETLDALLMPCA